MARPIITLTTDFGLSDHFTGTMKGVILSIAPEAAIVDISHEIPPFEVPQGAFVIAQAHTFFPKKTIHVVVVDPGVGTSRRPILVEAGGQYFIGPDNGVFSMILTRYPAKVRAITAEQYFLTSVSRTFHGRDIFAPCAAYLAKGVTPARFGRPVDNALRLNFEKPTRTSKRAWTGAVLQIDRFGNLITNYHTEEFGHIRERPFLLLAGMHPVERLAPSYGEGQPGELFVIEGSSGYFEVASNQASAAKMLGLAVGSPLELTIY
jgi:S-adenosyl-L-methionine hydrolase (adenosine-forming)